MARKTAEQNQMLEQCAQLIRRDLGPDESEALCHKVRARLGALTGTVDDRNSEAVRHHIHDIILPMVAVYQVLEESGFSREDALACVSGWMHEVAQQAANSMRRMAKLPFFYFLFSHISPKFMEKNYPIEGWDMRFNRCDKMEISFDCHRCVYLDVTAELGCPELCTAFCENDDITYGALMPKVHFIRTKTLADGGDCCDFRLRNGKYIDR